MLLTIILFTFSLASSRVIDRCSQWYNSSEGNICTYCPPGTYKYLDCRNNGESAICKGCGHDHYQTYCNQALSCERCSKTCPWRFSVPVHGEVCTMYTDMKCICEQGKYLFKETSEDGVCLKHTQCDKGFGLVEPGTPWSDTVCESCLEGKTFSDSVLLQHCRPCKLCAAFRRNCSTTRNSECKDKPTPDNPDNKLNKTANNNDNCSTTQDAECEDKPTPDNTDTTLNNIENTNHVIIKAMGSIIGTVLFIALVSAMAFFCKKRHKNNRNAASTKNGDNKKTDAATSSSSGTDRNQRDKVDRVIQNKDHAVGDLRPSQEQQGKDPQGCDAPKGIPENQPGGGEAERLLEDTNKHEHVNQPGGGEAERLLEDTNKHEHVNQPGGGEAERLLEDTNKHEHVNRDPIEGKMTEHPPVIAKVPNDGVAAPAPNQEASAGVTTQAPRDGTRKAEESNNHENQKTIINQETTQDKIIDLEKKRSEEAARLQSVNHST